MPSDPAYALDPEYPNLPRDVVEAYRDAPATVVAEVINGVFYAMAKPRPAHQSAGGELYAELSSPFRRGRGGPGGWIILPEPELSLGDLPDLAEPDVAGWRRERLPERPAGAAIAVVPDWVCEIHSNSTRRHDLTVKMPMYLHHGVEHVWLIEPELHTLQVCRHSPAGWLTVLHAVGDDPVRAPPFDAVELDLASLWRW
jgi:Uma2 family endonuclease